MTLEVDLGSVTAMPTASTTAGLRERKKARTRLALESAALELFERQGFEATTVDEIAEACEVSRRTFFRYFGSKEDVFVADHDEQAEHFRMLIAERPADEGVVDSVRAVTVQFASLLTTDMSLLRRRLAVGRSNQSLHQLAAQRDEQRLDELVDIFDQRRGHADADGRLQIRLVIGASMSAMRSVLEQWIADGAEGDLVAMSERAFDLLSDAFASSRSRRPLR